MGDHPAGQVGWLGTGRTGSVLTRRLLAAGPDVRTSHRLLVNLDYHATFTSLLIRKDFDLGLAASE
jgi:nucleoside-diphosphate-sugar epimerase